MDRLHDAMTPMDAKRFLVFRMHALRVARCADPLAPMARRCGCRASESSPNRAVADCMEADVELGAGAATIMSTSSHLPEPHGARAVQHLGGTAFRAIRREKL